jgi:hypothetical protein
MKIKSLIYQIRILTIALIATFAMASNGWAANYYVDQDGGRDSNPGTASQPFSSISKVQSVVSAGDTVYFDSADTWTGSGTFITAEAGVTFDGATWGSGTRATLQSTGGTSPLVKFSTDHVSSETVVTGFEIDVNNKSASGVSIGKPGNADMTGQTKRLENCVIHDINSKAVQYGLKIGTSGGTDHVANVEVLNNEVYNTPRTGMNAYAQLGSPNDDITNVTFRGNTVHDTGQDPTRNGNGISLKNHIIDAVVEYNYIYNCGRGISHNASSGNQ